MVAWRTAADKSLKKVETTLNNIVRTITWNKKFLRVTQLYKNLKLLKLKDIYAKFMHQIYNNETLFLFQDKFSKLKKYIPTRLRKPRLSNFFLPRVLKNAGQKKLEFRGVKLWNSLDKNLKSKSFIWFKKNYKKVFYNFTKILR